MVSKRAAQSQLDELEKVVKEAVLASIMITNAVDRFACCDIGKLNRHYVRGLERARELVRNWSLLKGRNIKKFPEILEHIRVSANKLIDLGSKLEKKATISSSISFEEMLKAILLLRTDTDGLYTLGNFGRRDRYNNAVSLVKDTVWKMVKNSQKDSSSPKHTFKLSEIIYLRNQLERLQEYLWESSPLRFAWEEWTEHNEFDKNDLLLKVLGTDETIEVISDILVDFSTSSLLTFLGGRNYVRDLIKDFEKSLIKWEDNLQVVEEKRDSRKKESRDSEDEGELEGEFREF